jgi:porin
MLTERCGFNRDGNRLFGRRSSLGLAGGLVLAFAFLSAAPAPADQQDGASAAKEQADIFAQEKLTGEWGGLRKTLEDAGVKFTVNEQSELWANLRGGKRTGIVYDGLTTPSLMLDLNKLLKWEGATFFVNAYQIHGVGPSSALVGNQQLISNIEATPATKLYQIWIEQNFFGGRVNIRVGQEGANDEMMTSQTAQLFLNSSFGYPDLLEQDLPSGGPNYPLATPVIRTKVKVTDEITYVNAVFNGDPAGPGRGDPQLRDASGTAFRLNDPPLIFNEIWYEVGADEKSGLLPGTYKVGSWVHTGRFNNQGRDTSGLSLSSPFSSHVAARFRGDYAFYAVADQMVWRKPGAKDQGIALFGLIMGAPDDRNPEDFYAEGGFNWKGLFESRPQDTFGLAFGYAQTSASLQRFGEESIAFTGSGKRFAGNETVIEATYLYQAAPWWTVQPDLQYVFNPGAALPATGLRGDLALKDSLTVGVRTKIDF